MNKPLSADPADAANNLSLALHHADQAGYNRALRDLKLRPEESLALAVAHEQIRRGVTPSPNVTVTCIRALERLVVESRLVDVEVKS